MRTGSPSSRNALTGGTVPIECDLQEDNERIPRDASPALFDAFASKEKTPHANGGARVDLPRFEADSTTRFLAWHLGRTAAAPA